jgi:hypothetical protein
MNQLKKLFLIPVAVASVTAWGADDTAQAVVAQLAAKLKEWQKAEAPTVNDKDDFFKRPAKRDTKVKYVRRRRRNRLPTRKKKPVLQNMQRLTDTYNMAAAPTVPDDLNLQDPERVRYYLERLQDMQRLGARNHDKIAQLRNAIALSKDIDDDDDDDDDDDKK